MKRTRSIRATAFFLAVLMLCGLFGVSGSAAETIGNASASTNAALRELLLADSYTEYNRKHPTARGEESVEIDARELYSYSDGKTTYYYDAEGKSFYSLNEAGEKVPANADELAVSFGEYGGKDALLSPVSGTLAWQVTIPASGRYGIEIEYYPLGENSSAIERVLYLDGKVPFAQARYLTLSKNWKYSYTASENGTLGLNGAYVDENGYVYFRQDVNGNQLKPAAVMTPEWMTYQFSDPDGFHQGAFEFYFDNENNKTGSLHTIALASTREAMAIKAIRVFPVEDLPSYADVLASYKDAGYTAVGKDASIRIETEAPYSMSDTSVSAGNDRTSAVNSPNSSGAQMQNVLGSQSYDTIGQWASYRFTVTETGLYTISIRCKQDKLAGMYTSRTLRLAGGDYGDELAVPFAEAYNCRFNYDKAWQIVTLGDGESVFQFYFEEGETYTLSLDVSLGTLSSVIEEVERSLDVINDCYLEILKLTGAQPDEYRDYRFGRVMPNTVRNLNLEHKALTKTSELLTALSGSKGAHVATLDQVAYLLGVMGSNEDKIAENLDDLKSYIGTLGTWLNTSKQQSLMMDYIVVSGSSNDTYDLTFTPVLDEQYKVNANFLESIWYEITSFFTSFFVDYNQMGVTTPPNKDGNENDDLAHVEVWLATGRDQANIWRALIDSSFSSTEAGEGVAVDLKLVDGGTLLPSVLAKQGPDVYIGLDSGSVINYAIRSAVLPLNNNPDTAEHKADLQETLKDFNEATLVPLTMYNKIYGVPETVSFSMMFYRKDTLADLGLDVPQTWDDLLTCVPVLQNSNMQIGIPGDYNLFLYQRGGDRWSYQGTNYSGTKYADLMADEEFSTYFDYMQIAYGEDIALDAFRYMTRFFTDYSFPIAFDGANRFRTGEMPIIIGDAVGLYNQLTVFATEIRGLWMFTNVPGTVRSDGTVSNMAIAGVGAIVMMNGVEDPAASWKFMKWIISPDVQATYGNSMVALIGPAAKYNTANMKALSKMSWTTEEYENLYSQFNNLATIPNYPGAYIIDRYLSFAYLNTVNNGADPVEELQSYIKTINKEINRKREEFELPILPDSPASTDEEKIAVVDEAIENYLAYLRTLSDDALAEYGFSDTTLSYIKNHS